MLPPNACGPFNRKGVSSGPGDSGSGAFAFPAGLVLLAAGLALSGDVLAISLGRKEIAACAKYGLEWAGTKEQIYSGKHFNRVGSVRMRRYMLVLAFRNLCRFERA